MGTSLSHKDKNGDEMRRDAPSSGFATEGDWVRPLFRMWMGAKPDEKAYSYLFAHINSEWGINFSKPGTHGGGAIGGV